MTIHEDEIGVLAIILGALIGFGAYVLCRMADEWIKSR